MILARAVEHKGPVKVKLIGNASCCFVTGTSTSVFLVKNVKREDMGANIDLKACLILERLRDEIPDAQIEYECGRGMHRFAIVHDTLDYDVGFPERLLEACGVDEIDRAIRLFVERVRTGAGPRRIKVGTRSGDRRSASFPAPAPTMTATPSLDEKTVREALLRELRERGLEPQQSWVSVRVAKAPRVPEPRYTVIIAYQPARDALAQALGCTTGNTEKRLAGVWVLDESEARELCEGASNDAQSRSGRGSSQARSGTTT
jgi:hypothetical protein